MFTYGYVYIAANNTKKISFSTFEWIFIFLLYSSSPSYVQTSIFFHPTVVLFNPILLLVLHIIFDLFFPSCSRCSKRFIIPVGSLFSIVRSNRLCLLQAHLAHCSVSSEAVYTSSAFFLALPSLIGFGIHVRRRTFSYRTRAVLFSSDFQYWSNHRIILNNMDHIKEFCSGSSRFHGRRPLANSFASLKITSVYSLDFRFRFGHCWIRLRVKLSRSIAVLGTKDGFLLHYFVLKY